MSLIIPPGYGLASYVLDGAPGTGPFVTTMGHKLPLGQEDAEASAFRLYNLYNTNILTRTSNQLTLVRVNLLVGQDGPENGSVVYEGNAGGGSAGADAAISMSVIMRKTTATLGRAGRGRCFLPGLLANEEVDINGNIGTSQVSAIQADVNDWYDDLTFWDEEGPDYRLSPVLLHSNSGTPSPITSFSIAPKVGWIRKRIR